MVKAIVVHEHGGPEKMVWEDVEVGDPGPGEARVKHEAVGLNFIDVYFRTGLYKPANGLPYIPGNEGAGTVVAVGSGVTHLKPGDRVSYNGPTGSYCEERIMPADRLVVLPPEMDIRIAAAVTLKGLTAQYLLRQSFQVGPEHTILFHAAAGGVGLIACQWAHHLGATVIGTVSSDEKAALARAHGCDHVINYTTENFVERVAEITNGEKCDVVYDSVGRGTFPGSLDCLKPLGLWALFGQSSGVVEGFDLGMLAQRGSLFVTRPTLFHYASTPEKLRQMADETFQLITDGTIKVEVKQEFALKDAAEAHRALEGRKTTGATVLIP